MDQAYIDQLSENISNLGMNVILPLLIIFLAYKILKGGLITVPQGEEYLVERLGKFRATLKPGMHLLIPVIDKVRHKVNMQTRVINLPPISCFTNDNATLDVDAVVFLTVSNSVDASYKVLDLDSSVKEYTSTFIRNFVGQTELDECLGGREKLKSQIETELAKNLADWGTSLKSVEVQNLEPSPETVKHMERQVAAKREARQTEITATAQKNALILLSEGELQASKNKAEARKVEAKAEADANSMIAESIEAGSGEGLTFQIALKYTEALQAIGQSDNSKLVMMPMETSGVISSISSIGELINNLKVGGKQ